MIKLILESECLMLLSGMAADKFKEMLDQEMSVLPKTISKHFTDTYYGRRYLKLLLTVTLVSCRSSYPA